LPHETTNFFIEPHQNSPFECAQTGPHKQELDADVRASSSPFWPWLRMPQLRDRRACA
jgi:hypothetical protein